mmetsp:Transcript_4600/g.11832  ORF Transcript_4600/g.11832 Transcript_4600/m.11832 type:complete len:128 (-) Transcript_4600:424-807(-)|eukprot:CAMPEP_0197190266 /NCGR_PEP_ID=MMETSP1423-20130617/21320_1 /TAXON_ID=476441 /ORGANISM="Pseudo-nitzschia heimii, Strain UNC1101" /LENGTH=127 /DNA_ID=CAMNT_0042642609 /DNA_START=123 /DNA_END=506 /DNA_ORIENTATION=+
MVKGRQGLYLEAWKFAVYVSIPVVASAYFSDPKTLKQQAEYWKFIEYPENPNTNVRQKIQKLANEKEEQREQRKAYQRQLQELQRSAARSSSASMDNERDEDPSDRDGQRTSWWRLWGGPSDASTKN